MKVEGGKARKARAMGSAGPRQPRLVGSTLAWDGSAATKRSRGATAYRRPETGWLGEEFAGTAGTSIESLQSIRCDFNTKGFWLRRLSTTGCFRAPRGFWSSQVSANDQPALAAKQSCRGAIDPAVGADSLLK